VRSRLVAAGAVLLAVIAGSPHPAAVAPPARAIRIGVLFPDTPAARAPMLEALREGLREQGYVEGRQLALDVRFAENREDRLPALAAELVRAPVDVLVTGGTTPTAAAQRATATIPIVMVGVGDPLARGFVASFDRPGGNITGSSDALPDTTEQRFQLLKEALPGVTRVAYVHNAAVTSTAAAEAAARRLGLTLQPLDVRAAADVDRALRAVRLGRPDALVVVPNPVTFAARHRFARLGLLDGVAVVFGWREFMDADGLMAYGANLRTLYRRAAIQVDQILNGRSPAELPVERPRLQLVINLRTARALGVTVAPSVLSVADDVIQ